jgi:KUP system potassium uptake protein
MYSDPEMTPPALIHNIEHNKVLHENVILLSIQWPEIPYVPHEERVNVRKLEKGFYQVILNYGFMEYPNVPRVLTQLCDMNGIDINMNNVSYFLGRERVLPSDRPGMARWREVLFAFMSRNARNATDFFRLPPDRVVEVGAEVEI